MNIYLSERLDYFDEYIGYDPKSEQPSKKQSSKRPLIEDAPEDVSCKDNDKDYGD